MADGALQAGADRFRGFGDLYDEVRPVPPIELGELIAAYSGVAPELVVDLDLGVDRFEQLVHDRLGHQHQPWRFVYRVRLAFTP